MSTLSHASNRSISTTPTSAVMSLIMGTFTSSLKMKLNICKILNFEKTSNKKKKYHLTAIFKHNRQSIKKIYIHNVANYYCFWNWLHQKAHSLLMEKETENFPFPKHSPTLSRLQFSRTYFPLELLWSQLSLPL
jgi:hypothetical protein